jgi:hypothetical protein
VEKDQTVIYKTQSKALRENVSKSAKKINNVNKTDKFWKILRN